MSFTISTHCISFCCCLLLQAGKGRTGVMICCLLLYLHKNAPDLANLTAAAAASGSAICAGPGLAPIPLHSAAAEQRQTPTVVRAKAYPASPNSSEGTSQHTASKAQHSSSSAGQHSSSTSSTGQHSSSSRQWHPWQSVPPVQLQQLDQPVRDILGLYAERRTHDGNGVTIHSQRRCVRRSAVAVYPSLCMRQASQQALLCSVA
jgi:hypothetical protein